MTIPTQAQIEAAAKAIALSRYKVDAEMWERWKRDPLWGIHAGDCEIAEPNMRGPITCNQCVVDELMKDAIAALAAAAEVGRTGQEASDNATSSLDWTGEAGEPWHKMYAEGYRVGAAATIERCAQVAENFPSTGSRSIAAAIRAMKEGPIDPNLQYPGKDPNFVFPEE